MCLFSKTDKATKATNDIKCYKVVYKVDGDKVHKTPYRHTTISDDIINGKEDFKARDKKKITDTFFAIYRIEGGFIHTYDNLIVASQLQYQLNCSPLCCGCAVNYYIYECVIPKGTYYFEGNDGDYASRKIRFVRKID